ncbi:MAG: hypothetical protein ACYDCQ_11475, partial [Dehalococcoidia bacterium]
MIGRRWLLAGVAIAACTVGAVGVRTGDAQTPPAAAPSPEEAILSLLPFQLQPADVPAGFQLVTEGATTPSELAYTIGNTQDESQQILKQIQRDGYQVALAQALVPDEATPVRAFIYQMTLLSTDLKAGAFLHNTLNVSGSQTAAVDNPPVPVRLGDESGAVHIVLTRANSNNAQREILIWRRGRVVFEVELETFDSTESLDQAVPVAVAADRRAATLTPPPVAQAARSASGSEEYRVDALYGLSDRLPDATQAPVGLLAEGAGVLNNADLLLEATDPNAMYTRLAQSWKRVTGVQTRYDTLQSADGEVLTVAYTLSADAAGAHAYLLDPDRRPGAQSFMAYGLPQPLGDDGRLYYETYTTGNGVAHDSWRAMW